MSEATGHLCRRMLDAHDTIVRFRNRWTFVLLLRAPFPESIGLEGEDASTDGRLSDYYEEEVRLSQYTHAAFYFVDSPAGLRTKVSLEALEILRGEKPSKPVNLEYAKTRIAVHRNRLYDRRARKTAEKRLVR